MLLKKTCQTVVSCISWNRIIYCTRSEFIWI